MVVDCSSRTLPYIEFWNLKIIHVFHEFTKNVLKYAISHINLKWDPWKCYILKIVVFCSNVLENVISYKFYVSYASTTKLKIVFNITATIFMGIILFFILIYHFLLYTISVIFFMLWKWIFYTIKFIYFNILVQLMF